MARVWPRLVVSENSLQVHISALRKALDPDGAGQSHVWSPCKVAVIN